LYKQVQNAINQGKVSSLSCQWYFRSIYSSGNYVSNTGVLPVSFQ